MESGDYQESTWSSRHDFQDARRHFDQNAGRSYSEAKRTGKTNADLLPKKLETLCKYVLAIIGDVTGSMGDAPGVYFAKCPYVLHEVKTEYMGSDTDILFGALGDANEPDVDKYPLQFRQMLRVNASPEEAKKRLMELITTEKGGGGQEMENYELAALYLARNVSSPNAVKRVCILIGDEAPYGVVKKDLACDVALVDLKRDLKTEDVFEELKKDWDIYFIQRPYSNGCGEKMDFTTAKINQKWVEFLGFDHVAYLPDIDRVVDVMFGILGDATDKYEYFIEEITDRQGKDNGGQKKIEDTFKALGEIHKKHLKKSALPDGQKTAPGGTILHKSLDGEKTKRLLDN